MRSWENATVDMCCEVSNPFEERENRFLYGKDFEASCKGRNRICPDVKAHFYLFNTLVELCELLIKGSRGIAQQGIIKRLLASRDVGIILSKDGYNINMWLCYGKKKDKVNADKAFLNELWVNIERISEGRGVEKAYIELGFNYISSFNDPSKVFENIPFVTSNFIDSEGRTCVKVLHSDVEPGFYHVQYYIWSKLSEKDKKIYRTTNQWKVVPDKYKGLCSEIVKLVLERNRGSFPGSSFILKEMGDTVGIVSSVSGIVDYVSRWNGNISRYVVKYNSTEIKVEDRVFIESMLGLISQMPLIHSIKWESDVEDCAVYLCRSWEEGAVDLWVR